MALVELEGLGIPCTRSEATFSGSVVSAAEAMNFSGQVAVGGIV